MITKKDLNNTNPYSTVITDDGRIHWGKARQLAVEITEDFRIKWASVSNDTDFPAEKYVLCNTSFDNGKKTGKLGCVDNSDLDIDDQMVENIKTVLANYLTDYKELDYVYEIEKNMKNQTNNRYSVTLQDKWDEAGVGCTNVYATIEVVLLNKYDNLGKSDRNQRNIAKKLFKDAEFSRRLIKGTKAGFSINAMLTKNFSQDAIEFNEENHNAYITMEFELKYWVKS